jgi:hypothetical protein
MWEKQATSAQINDGAGTDFSLLELFHRNFTEYKLMAAVEAPQYRHSAGCSFCDAGTISELLNFESFSERRK